jgi:hypothetical protein
MTASNRALIMLADGLRQRRTTLGTRWRRLDAGRHALLVVAYLRKGETYADLVGRPIWVSPALPWARHDMGAAREHGIVDAITDAAVRALADTAYRGGGPAIRVPQRRRRLDPTPAATARSRPTRRT